MNGCRSRTRRRSTSDAGRKPRRPMSMMSPPLTTSMTGPLTTPSASFFASMSPHARSYCARFFDRMSRPSLSSFGEDERFEALAERDDLVGVDVVADRQLLRGDDALGLVADVEEHLVRVDLDDFTGDDVAVVEGDDRGVDRVLEGHAARGRCRRSVVSSSRLRPPRRCLPLTSGAVDVGFRGRPRWWCSGAASCGAGPGGGAVVSVCWSNTSFLIVGTVGGRAGSPIAVVPLVLGVSAGAPTGRFGEAACQGYRTAVPIPKDRGSDGTRSLDPVREEQELGQIDRRRRDAA